MTKQFNYRCSHCQEVVQSGELKKKVLPNLVYEFYHHCPNCNQKHTSYYTDKRIRRDINRLTKKRKRWAQSKTVEQSRKLLAQIKLEDRLIEKDMNRLKEKMTKTLTKQ